MYTRPDTEEIKEDVSYNASTYSYNDRVQEYQEGSTCQDQGIEHVKDTPHKDTHHEVKGFFQGNTPAHSRIILFFLNG